MPKRSFSINDETDHLLRYYLDHSEKEWDIVINEAIAYYVRDHLTPKQVKEATKHTGKDAFPTDEVMRGFNSSWMNGDA